MVIESVTGAAKAYQGSVPAAEPKSESEIDVVTVEMPEQQARMKSGHENENAASMEQREQEAAKQNGQIRKAVEDINKNNPQTEAIFGIHDGTNRVTIKIVDKQSKKVIKEYPPEKTLDMIEKVWEMAGIMVDEKR